MRGHARLVAAVIYKLTLTNWGAPQTTNLGVWSSNLSGRAIFRDIPCDSHGSQCKVPMAFVALCDLSVEVTVESCRHLLK
jgi:hypothetical protein